MFINNAGIVVPAKGIVVDVLTRNGAAGKYDTTPYDGMASLLSEQWKDGVPVQAMHYVALKADYDASSQKPEKGPYIKRTYQPSEWLLNFEDIDPSWIRQYARDVIIGVKKNSRNSLVEYSQQTRVLSGKVADDESGVHIVERSDLLVQEEPYTAVEQQQWLEEIPAILYRLHQRSKEEHISLLSLFIAYEAALDRHKGTDVKISPRHILGTGKVRRMTKEGTVGDIVYENKKLICEYWMKWIRGLDGFADSYFSDGMRLVYICKRLGIDFAYEDPTVYNEEFIESLAISFVPNNSTYMTRNQQGLAPEMLQAIRGLHLEDFETGAYKEKQTAKQSIYEIARGRMIKYDSSLYEWCPKQAVGEMGLSMKVEAITEMLTGRPVDIMKLRLCDGFYVRNRTQPYIFDLSKIYKTESGLLGDAKAILHCSGTFVLVADAAVLTVLPVDYAFGYAKAKDTREGSWKGPRSQIGWGRWISTYL